MITPLEYYIFAVGIGILFTKLEKWKDARNQRHIQACQRERREQIGRAELTRLGDNSVRTFSS